MPTIEQITHHLKIVHKHAKTHFHRRLIVLSGTPQWCNQTILHLQPSPLLTAPLLIGNVALFPDISQVPAEKLAHHLGYEYSTLIWDGFSGLSPDGLGIASGLLKGGGLFFLLLPTLSELVTTADPDYLRMCSDADNLASFSTYFLKRLCSSISKDENIMLIEENNSLPPISFAQSADQIYSPNTPSLDQLEVINAIKRVALGHRHRPLVIKANRGRGKSSAIGLAAAELYLETGHRFVITAPNKLTCEAAFKHFKYSIYSKVEDENERKHALSSFQFIPLDGLLSESNHGHMLFIDEAAAIPNSILLNCLQHYSRVVFATTIHGYEGNGQGFALRFQASLLSLRPESKFITMSTPLRWAPNDPLEQWFFDLLLLNSTLDQYNLNTESTPRLLTTDSPDFVFNEISRHDLAHNEILLKSLFSLLVTAHYQTKPSDLRILLDHPRIKVLIASSIQYNEAHDESHPNIIGACLVLEEGDLALDSDTINGIIEGRRRLRGHLFPQALLSITADSAFLSQKTYRVMRIAVHPTFQRLAIGSQLLAHLKQLANENKVDSLSTSYGLTDDLLHFWQNNNFSVVKLGLKVDGASGLQSVMMMQPLSSQAVTLFKQTTELFKDTFLFDLTRQFQQLSPKLIVLIVQKLSFQTKVISIKKVEAYAFKSRALEETMVELFNLVLEKITDRRFSDLETELQELLVMKVLQNHNSEFCIKHVQLSGKKQLDECLRKAVAKLLSN